MRVAILTTDNRENDRNYARTEPYFGTAVSALLHGLALQKETEVHVVCCTQQPMDSPPSLAPNTQFHSLHVPKLGWLRTGYQGCIRAVRKKLKEISPDVVHGQGTERDCSLSAVLSGYPNVITIHGNMRLISVVNRARPLTYQWLAARLESFTVPRSGGVVCISRYTQNAVQAEARKTWLVPNAVEPQFFDVSPVEQTSPVILCVGCIQQRKNFNALIRALDPLAKQIPFELVFAGGLSDEEPYCSEFRSLIPERPWCKHLGPISRNELFSWLQKSTALALPSLEDNCPMVVLEAMAAGIPVVASRVGGVPELVEDQVSGFLCEPSEPSQFSVAIERLLQSPSKARGIGQHGRAIALRRFHPSVVAQAHLDVYREMRRG